MQTDTFFRLLYVSPSPLCISTRRRNFSNYSPPFLSLPLNPYPTPSLSDFSLSIFLRLRSIPPYHSFCVPQLRLLGTAFQSVSRLRSSQGGVVTVLVRRKGVRLSIVPVSIDYDTRIGRFPPPPTLPHQP